MKHLLCLLAVVLLLSSCASKVPPPAVNDIPANISEETDAADSPSREAVFVYGNQKTLPSKIILRFSGEPVLLTSGYVRLMGVVGGSNPTACLDVSGRGLALGKGEMIDAYRIIRIDSDRVVLER